MKHFKPLAAIIAANLSACSLLEPSGMPCDNQCIVVFESRQENPFGLVTIYDTLFIDTTQYSRNARQLLETPFYGLMIPTITFDSGEVMRTLDSIVLKTNGVPVMRGMQTDSGLLMEDILFGSESFYRLVSKPKD